MTDRSVRTTRVGPSGTGVGVNEDELTALLAERVMGWKAAPDRFMKPGRSWIPRWRFQPFEELEDAFQLLDRAAESFRLTSDNRRGFTAEVHVGGRHGMASGVCKARMITTAIALALGLEDPANHARGLDSGASTT
jgi:hypothetical protein